MEIEIKLDFGFFKENRAKLLHFFSLISQKDAPLLKIGSFLIVKQIPEPVFLVLIC